MKNPFSRYSKYTLGFLVIIFTLSLVYWVGDGAFLKPGLAEANTTQKAFILSKDNPLIRATIAVQNRHTQLNHSRRICDSASSEIRPNNSLDSRRGFRNQ